MTNDNQLRITFQSCNGFVTCSGRSGELLYITFLRSGMSTIGLYPEYLVPEIFYFQLPSIKKNQSLHQKLLKEVNGDEKLLKFPYL